MPLFISLLIFLTNAFADTSLDLKPFSEIKGQVDSLNVSFVGGWTFGKLSFAVEVDSINDVIFASSGGGIYVLDVSDPTNPFKISDIAPMSDVVLDIFLRDDGKLFVAAGKGGVEIWDVKDPYNPVRLSRFYVGKAVWTLATFGDYLYVADETDELKIVKINNPYHPFTVDSLRLPFALYGVYVSDSLLFIADGEGGLIVADITIPEHPVIIGSYDTPGFSYRVEKKGNYAYVADGTKGLVIVDVSVPTQPQFVSRFSSGYTALNLRVRGNILYMAQGKFLALDISDPFNPSLIWDTRIYPGLATNLRIARDYAYVSFREGGIAIFHLTENDAELESVYPISGFSTDLALFDNCCAIGKGEAGFSILDVSDPEYPREMGRVEQDTIDVVATNGNYLFVGGPDNKLEIYDVSNPSDPVIVTVITFPSPLKGLTFHGNYMYLADGEDGLRIVDISTISYPLVVGYFNTPGSARDVEVINNNIALVADGYMGLRVINVSDPENPSEMGYCYTPDFASSLELRDTFLYIADGFGGITIVKIADPNNPVLVTFLPLEGYARGISLEGDFAYVAADTGGLRVVDVSDPIHPIEIGHYKAPGDAYSVEAKDSLIFLTMGNGGLQIFKNLLLSHITIWPGDANNDGIVDERDVLPIGIFYGLTGSARSGGSQWAPDTISLLFWEDVRAAFADCNGDGVVDENDVLVIGQNWHLRHDGSFAFTYSDKEIEAHRANFEFLLSSLDGLGCVGDDIVVFLLGLLQKRSKLRGVKLGVYGNEVRLEVPFKGYGRLRLFDVAGRNIRVLKEGRFRPYRVYHFMLPCLPNGVYFVRYEGNSGILNRKFLWVGR